MSDFSSSNLIDAHRKITAYLDSPADSLRVASIDALRCILTCNDNDLLYDASPMHLNHLCLVAP